MQFLKKPGKFSGLWMFDRIRPYWQRGFFCMYIWSMPEYGLTVNFVYRFLTVCQSLPILQPLQVKKKEEKKKKWSNSALNGCKLLNYNFPDNMPGCVNYFFCSLEEVHFPTYGVICVTGNYLQVLELPIQNAPGTLSSLFSLLSSQRALCFFLFSLYFLCF